MSFGVEWRELEADYPLGGDSVPVDLGRGKVPTMRGLQGLVGEILARAGREEFSGCDVAGVIDVELDGYVNSAADSGARFGRNVGHDLLEDFALRDGTGGWFRDSLHTRRLGDAGEGCRRGCWGTRSVLVAFFQRWGDLRCPRRRQR